VCHQRFATSRSSHVFIVALVTLAALIGAATAAAVQVPTGYPGTGSVLSFPSGLTVSVAVPGDGHAAAVTNNNMGIAGRYSGASGWSNSAYTPGVATSTLPYSWFSKIDNSNASGASNCLNRTLLRNDTLMRCAKGDLTYTFSRPVKNPTFHISNIGGWTWWSVGGANSVWPRMAHHMDIILTLDRAGSQCTATPELSLRSSLGNFQVTTDGAAWLLASGDTARLDGAPAITRSSGTVVGSNTYAVGKLGSGSVQITGTCTSVTFNRDLLWRFAFASSANQDVDYQTTNLTQLQGYYNCLFGQFPLALSTSLMTQCTTNTYVQTGSPDPTLTDRHFRDPPDAYPPGDWGWVTHRYSEENDMTWSIDEDFGDAPATFDAANGASHVLSDLSIGSAVSSTGAETVSTAGTAPNNTAVASGIVSPIASGTDAAEDAFASAAPTLTAGSAYTVTVPISGASAAGQVCGFLDVNRSGTFTTSTPDERQCATFASGATSVTLTWPGTATSSATGSTWLRLRAAYGATSLAPTGRLDSGEVEDWAVALVAPLPTASPDTTSGFQGAVQTTNLLTNDAAGAGATMDTTSVLLCDTGETSPACTKTSVTVTGVGTYTVSGGTITFTPLSTYIGTPAALPYTVADNFGQKAASTYTPTVIGPPTASPDTTSGLQGVAQMQNLLTNDTAAAGTTLTASTVRLCGASETSPSCTQTTVSVFGVGTYTVSSGTITFTPVSTYIGTPAALPYTVTDNLGQKAASTYTPTVIGPPTASPDTTSGLQGAGQTKQLLTNDAAATGATLDATSVLLCDTGETSPACTKTSVTVSSVGTYTVNTAGLITFTPLPAYTGTPAALPYTVEDNLDQKVASTYTPTVIGPPTASPDTTSGLQGQVQTRNLLTNDAAATGATLDATSVLLCDTGETSPACTKTSVTVSGVGTYTVSGGTITFTPLLSYVGTPPALPYTVEDNVDQKVASTYTPTVIGPPTASPDTTSGLQGQVQTRNLLTNDAAATGATLDATSVLLCDTGETSPACTKTSVTVSGVGTYTVSGGTITFTPLSTYVGTPPALPYTVEDNLDQKVASTYTPTVIASSVALPDTTSGLQGAVQTRNLLTNDVPAAGATLIATSVLLCDTGETSPACTKTSVTVNGVGTYQVDNAGLMTFTPLLSYVGTPAPLPYIATDSLSVVVASTYTPTVVDIPSPTASPDTTTGLQGAVQTKQLLTNDAAATGATLDATSVLLCDIGETSPACTKTSVTISGVGTYTVSTAGLMTFTPLPGYVGTPAALPYTVEDNLDQKVASTYTPTVIGPPTASPDTTTGGQGQVQTKNLLTNDTAASGATLTSSSVLLCDTGETSPACTKTSVTVTGVGTYTVSGGTITFTPLSSYVGTSAALPYTVTDSFNQKAASTYTPTVVGVPTASPDTTTGGQGQVQTTQLLTNDAAATGATLDATSVLLCGAGETSPMCTKTTVTVSGVGTYSVSSTGLITFTPLSTYVGMPPALSYTVEDSLDQKVASTYTPTVIGVPTATPDTTSGLQGVVQTRNLLTNDAAATGATLDATSVLLCDTGETSPACTKTSVTVSGVGTYTVSAVGLITFTPLPSYAGIPPALPYTVEDSIDQKVASTYTPTVIGPPTASPDTTAGLQGNPQTINLLTNDAAATGATLDATSVLLCDTGETSPACTKTSVTVSSVGTYTVSGSTITFTPLPAFTGTPAALPYTVEDNLNQKAASTYTPSIVPPTPPVASPNSTSGVQGASQVTDLLVNDAAGPWLTLDPTSVRLCGTGEVSPSCTRTTVVVAGVGTYKVDTAGMMTFTPEPGYLGTPQPITYVVHDSIGQTVTSTYTPTVTAPPATPLLASPLVPVKTVRAVTKLAITTTASRPLLRTGQQTTITLKVRNVGSKTALSTTTWAPIPAGFTVVDPNGGKIRGGSITFQLGDIAVKGWRVRTFVLVPTRASIGHAVPVMGRAAGSNVRPVKDPTRLSVIADPVSAPAVTG
jgi:CshA-type fibril repeat protein